MFGYLSLVRANTLRNRRRSALTAASIAMALCLLTVLTACYQSLFGPAEASPSEALRLMTHHKISITQPMPVSYEVRIRQIPGVRDAMVWQWFGGTYKDARDPRNFFARFAVEPDRLFRIRGEISLREDERIAFVQQRPACIVGRKLAQRFNWRPGERITLAGDIFPVKLELTIAGIYDDPENSATLFFHYDYLHELLKEAGLAADEVGVFMVQADSADSAIAVADAIDKEFENSPAPTETVAERAWQLSFISFLGNLRIFLASISVALGFTILLVSANTIAMAVRERTREVGIMKTLGFTPGVLIAVTLAESICIAIAGGSVGVALATLVCTGIRHSGTAFAALNLRINAETAAGGIAGAIVLGLASSLLPAWMSSRTSILDALRHSG